MSNYYVVDDTKQKGGQSPVIMFKTVEGIVKYLEDMCQRKFGKTRQQYMYNCSELGFGDDDARGQAFCEQLEQYFNMGVIRSDSTPIRCNVFQADNFRKGKAEHGN